MSAAKRTAKISFALIAVLLVNLINFTQASTHTNKLSFSTTYNTGGLLDLRVGDSAILPNNIKVVYDQAIDAGSGQIKAKFKLYDLSGNNVGEVIVGKNQFTNTVAANIQVKDTGNAIPGLIKVDINALCTSQYPCDAIATAVAASAQSAVSTGGGVSQGSGYGGAGYVVPTPVQPTTASAEIYDNDFPTLPSDNEPTAFSYINTFYPGWNLFSIPFDNAREYVTREGQKTIALESPELVSTTCSDSAKIYWYSAQERKYVKMGSVADFKSKQTAFSPGGTAYWIKVSESCTLQTLGNHATAFNAPSYIALEPGWSSFGSPAQQTTFEKVKNNCVVKSGPWKYNTLARKYEKATILQPGEGYFVKSAGKCTLSLPPLPPLPPTPLEETSASERSEQQLVQPTPAPTVSDIQVPSLRTETAETSTTVSSGTATRMKIGDKILEPDGHVIKLFDVAGFAQGTGNLVTASFIVFDSNNIEIDRLTLLPGEAYEKNGVYVKLIATSPSAYADVIVS